MRQTPSKIIQYSFSLFFQKRNQENQCRKPEPPPTRMRFPDNLISIIQQTPYCKKQAVKQKSHPQDVKSGQYISRKICACQQRQDRITFRRYPVISQNCRKQKLHSNKNPAKCQDSSCHRLSRTSVFLHISQQKWQQCHRRKGTQSSIKRLTDISHCKLLPPDSSHEIFRFCLWHTKYHHYHNPAKKQTT